MNTIYAKLSGWKLGVLLACFGAALLLLPEAVFGQSAPAASKPTVAEPKADAVRPFRIFDGTPRKIVLVTNSHGGGKQLEARLKKMPGGEKLEFSHRGGGSFNGEPGKTPPGWIPKDAHDDTMPVIYVVYNAVDASAIGKRPLPSKTLEQFSGDDLAKYVEQDVRDAAMSEAELVGSLKSLEHQVQHATNKGIDLLILSNTHYNRTGRGGPAGADGSEEAVRRWNETELGRLHPAVDVRTPSRNSYPLDVSADRFHPSEAGREIMAHGWFSGLCAWDGVPAPEWSQQMVDDALAKEKAVRAGITDVAITPAGPHKVGDVVTITWKAESKSIQHVTVWFSPSPGMWAAAPIANVAASAGRLEWKIPETIEWNGDKKPQTMSPISDHCYLRVASSDHASKHWLGAAFWRTTEVPFRILGTFTK